MSRRNSRKTTTPTTTLPPKTATRPATAPRVAVSKRGKLTSAVVLLAGGNPQIAKADGNLPVEKYLDALTGWQRQLGNELDALIVQTVPNVKKAVKWNSPYYGIDGQGWFLGMHTFTKYIKLAFFCGSSLKPMPPSASKNKNTRYLDIREGDAIDHTQLAKWFAQAAAIPGWLA